MTLGGWLNRSEILFSLRSNEAYILTFMGYWEGKILPLYVTLLKLPGLSGGSAVKYLPAIAGDTGLIVGLGRSPGEENNNPLQYSCLGNPMDRGAWWATVHGVTKELYRT